MAGWRALISVKSKPEILSGLEFWVQHLFEKSSTADEKVAIVHMLWDFLQDKAR